MEWGRTHTTFHDHVEGDACNERCLEVPFVGMDRWTKPIRTQRMQHNHIFQMDTVNGQWDCPACQSMDPGHMQFDYARREDFKLKNSGGWV